MCLCGWKMCFCDDEYRDIDYYDGDDDDRHHHHDDGWIANPMNHPNNIFPAHFGTNHIPQRLIIFREKKHTL